LLNLVFVKRCVYQNPTLTCKALSTLSPKTATVKKLSPKSATIVASVDRF